MQVCPRGPRRERLPRGRETPAPATSAGGAGCWGVPDGGDHALETSGSIFRCQGCVGGRHLAGRGQRCTGSPPLYPPARNQPAPRFRRSQARKPPHSGKSHDELKPGPQLPGWGPVPVTACEDPGRTAGPSGGRGGAAPSASVAAPGSGVTASAPPRTVSDTKPGAAGLKDSSAAHRLSGGNT